MVQWNSLMSCHAKSLSERAVASEWSSEWHGRSQQGSGCSVFAGLVALPPSLAKADDFWRSYAARHAVHRRVADGAAGIDDEHGRLCDAAPLAGIVNVPLPDHATCRVAQDHEGQGSRRSRRTASDVWGGSTDTATRLAPEARILSSWSR